MFQPAPSLPCSASEGLPGQDCHLTTLLLPVGDPEQDCPCLPVPKYLGGGRSGHLRGGGADRSTINSIKIITEIWKNLISIIRRTYGCTGYAFCRTVGHALHFAFCNLPPSSSSEGWVFIFRTTWLFYSSTGPFRGHSGLWHTARWGLYRATPAYRTIPPLQILQPATPRATKTKSTHCLLAAALGILIHTIRMNLVTVHYTTDDVHSILHTYS